MAGWSEIKKRVVILMRIRSCKRFTDEALHSIYKNKVLTMASITSVIATLFVFGFIYLVILNIDRMMHDIGGQVQVTVYIKDEINQAVIDELKTEILSWKETASVVYVTKPEAMKKMKEQMGEGGKVLDGYTDSDNPLPRSFEIRLHKPEDASVLANRLSRKESVDEIVYSAKVTQLLQKLTTVTQAIGSTLIVILLLVSFNNIGNTIKVAIFSKRHDIHIMKYIGATDWFIRWPFLIEGFFLGMVGALVAAILVLVVYSYAIVRLETILTFFTLIPVRELFQNIITAFLVLGVGIGCFASAFSVRKHLRA